MRRAPSQRFANAWFSGSSSVRRGRQSAKVRASPNSIAVFPPSLSSVGPSSVLLRILGQSREQTLHLFHRVVMYQPDTQHAAFWLNSEPFGEIHGVEISVPGENAAIAKELCDLCGVMFAHTQRNRGAAFAKPFRILDAVDLHFRNRLQAVQHSRKQIPFVGHGRSIGGRQRLTPGLHTGIAMLSYTRDVI